MSQQWDEQDWWEYSDVPADAYEYIRAVRLCDVAPEPLAVCDAECELPSSSTLCVELDRDDGGDEFFRECEEECEVVSWRMVSQTQCRWRCSYVYVQG